MCCILLEAPRIGGLRIVIVHRKQEMILEEKNESMSGSGLSNAENGGLSASPVVDIDNKVFSVIYDIPHKADCAFGVPR